METASLYKNGGVFLTFLHLLLNIFVHSKLPESKALSLKALETLINPQNPSNPCGQNNLSLDKSIEDPMISKAMSQFQKIKIVVDETILLKKIDQANETLTGILKYPNALGYLEPMVAKKPSDLPPLENLIYGYILYILLQKMLESDEDSHENNEIMKLIRHVIRNGGSGLRVLSEEFVGKEKQELLIQMETNKKKDKETEQVLVKELDEMLEEIKGAEMEKNIAAKQKEPQEDQRRLFNEFLGEKDEMDRFIKKNRAFVEKWLVPNLETRCAIVINTVQEMSRWYYEINKGSQGMMRFQEILMEGKGLGIWMEMLDKARGMKERFDKEYNDWDMKERRNYLKIKKKWTFQRSKLTQDRGIWQTEERGQEKIYYKIDKAEDFLRRRMRLKRDYQAQNKEYLSVAAYQEKYKAKVEQEMELKSEQAAAQRALRESSKGVSLRKSSSVKSNDKEKEVEKEEVELEFNEIPKEEILLVDTRETVVDFQESLLLKKKKKIIEKWKQPVEKIALKGAVYGDLEISQSKYISFSPSQIERPDDPPYCFGALKNSFIKNYKKKKQWKISNIKEVHARNYNLRPTAVEIFIKDDAKTYFFNLYTKELQQEFISLLKALNPKIFAIADRAKQFQELKIHDKWVEGELSNFEYLMILNTFAGRSFNDINQYPVFPWVLKDFTSETLDLETEDEEERKKIFRELDTPIGAIDARKRAHAKEKFDNWDDASEPKFHYGSHYSNAESVINFLIRLEPFTSLNIGLQRGKFDQADRLFASIRLAWHSCTHNRGDFRELTPEFYYMPEFLQNYNKMNFGKTQKNTDISEVELPPWANDKPEEFIMKHREALECDYVSQNLHKWIDLIFGSRQRGKKAAESYNVFRNISYEGGVDISQIEDKDMQSILLQQIFHSGQTPTQLFTEDHPARNVLKMKANKERLSYYILNKNALKKETNQGLNINLLFKENQHSIIHISKDPEYIHIIYKNMDLYSIPYNPKNGLYNHFLIWEEAKKSSIITNLGGTSLNEFYPSNQISTLLQPGRPTYHIIGGYPDNSFKIFKDGLIFDSILLHKKVVTAVHSACVPRIRQTIIAAGSKDCRISLWNFSSGRSLTPEQKRTPNQILYGHHNEITALYIENILGILVSCDKDNVVMVFCVSTGKLQRSIYPEMDADDYIKMVRVDENGFIILLTTKSVILTYSINGKFLMKVDEFSARTGHEISSLSFVDRHKPYIVIAVNFQERKGLVAIDYLTMREKKSLNTNMKYADKSHKRLLTKEVVKKQLKETAPTVMIMGDGEKFMYLGCGNGALAVLGGHYECCFEENKVALTDFGYET